MLVSDCDHSSVAAVVVGLNAGDDPPKYKALFKVPADPPASLPVDKLFVSVHEVPSHSSVLALAVDGPPKCNVAEFGLCCANPCSRC